METKLIELLKLCIEKNLSYSYYNGGAIHITKRNEDTNDFDFYEYVCIYDFLSEEKRMRNINELIEKVKNYKN